MSPRGKDKEKNPTTQAINLCKFYYVHCLTCVKIALGCSRCYLLIHFSLWGNAQDCPDAADRRIEDQYSYLCDYHE